MGGWPGHPGRMKYSSKVRVHTGRLPTGEYLVSGRLGECRDLRDKPRGPGLAGVVRIAQSREFPLDHKFRRDGRTTGVIGEGMSPVRRVPDAGAWIPGQPARLTPSVLLGPDGFDTLHPVPLSIMVGRARHSLSRSLLALPERVAGSQMNRRRLYGRWAPPSRDRRRRSAGLAWHP